MSESARGRLGWAAVALAILLAAGGASQAPFGWLLGVPSLPVASIVALAALAAMAWAPERGAVGLGLVVILGLILLGAPVPGLRALTGGPLFALALGALVLALSSAEVPWRPWFLPLVSFAYLLAAAQTQRQVGPEGDEPHYLMVADSLLRDHDLSLEQDYSEGRYRSFHPATLAPHYRVRGKNGEIYPPARLGALAPRPARLRRRGISGGVVLHRRAGRAPRLAGPQALEGRSRGRPRGGDDGPRRRPQPPLWSYAGLVFTEIPAALGAAVVLHRGRRPALLSTWGALALGAVLAFLPWLNVRHAVLSLLLALYVLAGRPGWGRAAALLGPPALSALGLMAYHFALYGFFDPRRVYGRRIEFSL